MEKPIITFSREEDPKINELKKQMASLERELLLLKHRVSKIEEVVKKTYEVVEEPQGEVLLEEIDLRNPKVVEILMDWVTFMLSRVGEGEFNTLMDYYISIGWISKEVAELLKRYAQGLRAENPKGYMEPEDHIKSLEYINRIREAVG